MIQWVNLFRNKILGIKDLWYRKLHVCCKKVVKFFCNSTCIGCFNIQSIDKCRMYLSVIDRKSLVSGFFSHIEVIFLF